jgi:large subunit ribosomal protein L1
MNFIQALQELRSTSEKRKFDQTLDLIINLKSFDPTRESVNTFVILPHVFKKKKIAAFLETIKKSEIVSRIFTRDDIEKLSLKEMKKFAKKEDFFISSAKLMPLVASKFGKILGSSGKMPDPKIGCVLMQEQEANLKEAVEKLEKTVKIKAKEKSLKIPLGKESMPNEQIAENLEKTYKAVLAALPKKEFNIREILIKFSMSKPIKVK